MTPQDRKLYENLQILVYALQLEDDRWPFEHLAKQEALNKIIIEPSLNLGFSPDNPQFLSLIEKKIYEILSQPPEQPVRNIPPKSILEADLEKGFDNFQQKKIEYTYPTLNEQIKKIRQSLFEKIHGCLLTKEPGLKTNPELVRIAAKNLTDKIIDNLPPTKVKATLFTPQEYQSLINKSEPEINKTISRLGFSENKITPQEKEILSEDISGEIKSLSTIPRRLVPFEKSKESKKESEGYPLSDEQIKEFEKIKIELQQEAESSRLTSNTTFTILQPRLWGSLAKRGLYAPRIASLRLAINNINPEYHQLIKQGLLTEDLELTFKVLKEKGLTENHPYIKYLENAIKVSKDLGERAPNANAIKNIERYSELDKLLGRKEVYYEPLQMKLPLHKHALYEEKGSYSYYLKEGLHRFRFISNTSQKFVKFLTRGKYKTPIEFIKGKITGRAAKWLAKTAFGKAFKSGLKKFGAKVGTKIALKLGIKAGVVAVGAATGPPGWIVAAISVVADVVIALAKKGVSLIQGIIRDPQKAFLFAIAGGTILSLASMPFALIGVIPLSIGAIGLVSFVAAPATIGIISSGIGTFFSSISTLPVALSVGPFIITIFAIIAGLTIFIVMVVSGAFILPQGIGETQAEVISPYESEFFELTKKIEGKNKFDNPKPEEGPIEVKYIITIKPKGDYVLIHPEISDKFSTSSEGNPPSIGSCNFGELPDEINPSTILTKECVKSFGSGFENTAIINTVILGLEVKGKTGRREGIASARVIIGDPPGECPEGWPTSGRITQGPEGATSHCNYEPSKTWCHSEEAIDIAKRPRGTPVYATHEGSATTGEQKSGAGYYVTISGTCDGIDFDTKYFHLSNQGRVSGPVKQGDFIGYMSNSGTGGVHLHYEFRPKRPNEPFRMEPDYIPEVINRTCNSSAQCDKAVISEYDVSR